jgi:hypothetical protein
MAGDIVTVMDFHKIWVEQCEAAHTIRERFGQRFRNEQGMTGGSSLISCRICGFWLLRGFAGDSHDFLREKSGGSAIGKRPRQEDLDRGR